MELVPVFFCDKEQPCIFFRSIVGLGSFFFFTFTPFPTLSIILDSSQVLDFVEGDL